jgi:hypothetical protein
MRRNTTAILAFGYITAMRDAGATMEECCQCFLRRFNYPDTTTTDSIKRAYERAVGDFKEG